MASFVFKKGNAYRLSRIPRGMWSSSHPIYGKPSHLVGVFRHKIVQERTWFTFDIYVRGKYASALFVPLEDVRKIQIDDMGPYTRKERTSVDQS